ncbi:MAG: amylo-alpha-1,6-glucosidase, partial [Lentisphaeraceae bacterium]|nr:amylo-alpha-1,6-glucosidase [Lentisphaeraceae bacterium]
SLLNSHPSFRDGSTIKLLTHNTPSILCFSRIDADKKNPLLIAINLDCKKSAVLTLDAHSIPEGITETGNNLLKTSQAKIEKNSDTFKINLSAGDSVVIGDQYSNSDQLSYNSRKMAELIIMKILSHSGREYINLDMSQEVPGLLENPVKYFNAKEIFTTLWEFPKDLNRHVLFSPYSVLILKAPEKFRVKHKTRQLDSFKAHDGSNYIVYKPSKDYGVNSYEDLEITIFGETPTRYKSTLLYLTAADVPFKGEIPDRETPVNVLDTNDRGGMMHLCLDFPHFNSRYDCLLGANLSKEFPENRHIMWRRMRIYCHHQAITLPLDESTLISSKASQGKAELIFRNPVGQGHYVRIKVTLGMIDNENATIAKIERIPAVTEISLPDHEPIQLFIRTDIEDRNFHMETKAHGNLEGAWAKCLAESEKGYTFSPDKSRYLKMDSEVEFVHEPEWSYNHHLRIEAERGLENHTDLFSPGFFKAEIKGGQSVKVLGQVITVGDKELKLEDHDVILPEKELKFEPALREAMTHYIVKRGELKTVIAGYPWFLDWGRDTLICVRGIISAGYTEDVKKILLQFGSFEENGTLPNMIHGGDASNRDTSDAPLWYFVAVEDLIKQEKSTAFLDAKAGNRTIREVLVSLAENIIKGTPNKIKMDADSGLVFSPSHFTWMDTNYPAGTPREGYPVEIQSLWYKALTLLSEITDNNKWTKLAATVQENFIKYFWDKERGFLSDCLHSKGGSAASASADDALRCNQLFAVTLGLVDKDIAKDVINSSEELLIPGAIRSLADRNVKLELPVHKDGHLLNDPTNPYWGNYEGDEDTRRKPAYHNGTAWSWPFPSYSEALYKVYGEKAKSHATAILNSSRVLFDTGCLEQIPEVLDGNAPHRHRGCDAQAWGITETYRVWHLLHS